MSAEKVNPILSDDAKALLGSVFINGCELSFGMVASRPTARCQAALDVLVKNGAVVIEPHRTKIGIKYKPCWPHEPYASWLKRNKKAGQFSLAEPIT